VAVLVTGAAGFIGSHVAQFLVEAGRAVVGLDRFGAFPAKSPAIEVMKNPPPSRRA
jgi:UDP-glucuronate 4-epimerase